MRVMEAAGCKTVFVLSLEQPAGKQYSLHCRFIQSHYCYFALLQGGLEWGGLWQHENLIFLVKDVLRQYKEEWDLCQRCQKKKIGHWCLLSKWQLPVGVLHQRLLRSSGKVVNFVDDGGDWELVLYPPHPHNCTAARPAGGKCSVQRRRHHWRGRSPVGD